jgi:hypothetical protein
MLSADPFIGHRSGPPVQSISRTEYEYNSAPPPNYKSDILKHF